MKKFLALVSGLSLAITTLFPPGLISAEINQPAVDYLKSQTQDAWTTMALSAAGETDLNLDHLKTVAGDTATDYEKAILAVVAAGENPKTFGDIDYVEKLKTDFYSQNQIGDPALFNDDIWGIMALSAAGETFDSQIMTDSKNFLIAHQNSDGGWSYGVGGQSDTNDTAAAIMALLDAGYNSSSSEIVSAVDFLKARQNSDGGFPYVSGFESDSGSDSWVISAIYKLGQDPKNPDWQKNNISPVDHLKSLQTENGSFKWQTGDAAGSASMTSFAVIALAEKYFPVINLSGGTWHEIRIEGLEDTVCKTEVAATTALQAVENAASVCGYSYDILDSSYGRYLNAVNSDAATGLSGWMYFVNFISPAIGAGDYVLQPGDEVLWYFGEWGYPPTRLRVSGKNFNINDNLTVNAEYYNGLSWLALPEAQIHIGSSTYTANSGGSLTVMLEQEGVFEVFTETAGYVRSDREEIEVGQIKSENLDLVVEVRRPEPELSFEVSLNNLDFGSMTPGELKEVDLTVTNTGQFPLYLESEVTGNNLFADNLKLNQSGWADFYTTLSVASNSSIKAQLNVPAGYTDFGVKNGQMIFWAVRAD